MATFGAQHMFKVCRIYRDISLYSKEALYKSQYRYQNS